MYAPMAGQEFEGYPPPQQIATGYQQPPQNPSPHPHLQPQIPYAQSYVQPPPPPPPQQGGSHHPIKWSSTIFGWTKDLSNCCVTCWFPCITFGQIAEILDEGSPPCFVSGAIYGALMHFTGCACCYSYRYRTKMRAKFNLAERPCGDCLLHCMCEKKALCQEYRELRHLGYDPALGWMGNLQRQQAGMGTATAPPGNPIMAR